MNFKIALEDFKKNKLINISLMIFILITSILISSALILSINLFTSMDNLMAKAKTPDYLQMHQGEIDLNELDEFSEKHPNVKEFQVLEFVNIDGNKISINGVNLENSVQDNGIVYQSPKFDYLLDLNNEIINVKSGEIYLPIIFSEDTSVGDKVKIGDEELIVSGLFRDSQMNSNMAGSKRLLLNEDDFNRIKSIGKTEYLIEFILNDTSKLIDFEKDFQDEIPYKNGVAVTGPMFKFVNALDDGIIVAVIVLATILIMFISTLCIRFTLMTKLEEEFLEIAVLKVIGISHKDIKRIYLSVYLILAGIGSILGYLIALFMQKSLLQNITIYMGNSEYAYLSPYIAILGPVLVFIFFATYIQIKLESVKNIKPVNALKNGESGLLENKKVKSNIKSRKLNNTNFTLALVDIRSKKSLYSPILALISLAVFLILVPFHIYNTSENESFVKSLGMGSIDLSIDIQAFDDIELKTHKILDKLKTDSKIEKFNSYEMKNVGIKDKTGKDAYLKVSVGDHESFVIDYKEGRAPNKEGEIALSALYMDDLELKLNDKFILQENGKDMTVVGVYADMSNGGRTAKVLTELPGSIIKNTIFVKVKNPNEIQSINEDYSNEFTFAKIYTVEDYIQQAFGSMRSRLKEASTISLIISVMIISLVISLFTKLLITKDKNNFAILKAIGFTNLDLQIKQLLSILIIAVVAIIIGILLANNLGGYIIGLTASSFGVNSIKLAIKPFLTYVLIPVFIIGIIIASTYFITNAIYKINISESIKE